uniref:Uncharacterized protein n=1 Tax=Cacopsylla melanoneura TaxID=428564 RepID=A0A8D8WN08_9HEMI
MYGFVIDAPSMIHFQSAGTMAADFFLLFSISAKSLSQGRKLCPVTRNFWWTSEKYFRSIRNLKRHSIVLLLFWPTHRSDQTMSFLSSPSFIFSKFDVTYRRIQDAISFEPLFPIHSFQRNILASFFVIFLMLKL